METISAPWPMIVVLIGMALMSVALAQAVSWVAVKRKPSRSAPSDLSRYSDRMSLQALLSRYDVIGDADIRDGVVMPRPILSDKVHPVTHRLLAAFQWRRVFSNPNAAMLYLRKPDGELVPLELDLDDLYDAASLVAGIARG